MRHRSNPSVDVARVVVCVSALWLFGCGTTPLPLGGGPLPDGSIADGAISDGSSGADASTGDGAVDGGASDGAVDGATTDGSIDAGATDAAVDGATTDGSIDAGATDAAVDGATTDGSIDAGATDAAADGATTDGSIDAGTTDAGSLDGSLLDGGPATLAQIVVSPMALSRPANDVVRYTAMAIYSDLTQQNVTQLATWTSTNPSVASTNGANVRTHSPGTTTIVATFQGVSGSTSLTVTTATLARVDVSPVAPTLATGGRLAFRATAVFSDNTTQDVTRQATWLSSTRSVATITTGGANAGLATAMAPGSTSITATIAGVTGSTTLTVTNATVIQIDVAPAFFTAAVGTTERFTAQAIYSDGTSRDVTAQATWLSSAPRVVAVNDGTGGTGLSGSAVALAPGSATISATFAGVTGTATFTVSNATLRTIEVTPFLVTLPVGFAMELRATGIYSDNTTLDLTARATWSSSTPAVAAVSDAVASRGLLTALSPGSATISATYGGVTGVVVATVTSASLTAIQIMPSMPVVARFATLPLIAIGTFSDGTILDLTTFVTWLSSSPSVANVSNATGSAGLATGLSSGTTTVSAIRGSVTGTATLTVP